MSYFFWDAVSSVNLSFNEYTDEATVDPLNLDQWAFYVLATAILDQTCGAQKTITLPRLQQVGQTGGFY